jgi:hypothetical protein
MKVVIDYIYEDSVNLIPILPLVGKGEKIFTCMIKKENKLYLEKKLSH